jgi:hypothetical protein
MSKPKPSHTKRDSCSDSEESSRKMFARVKDPLTSGERIHTSPLRCGYYPHE